MLIWGWTLVWWCMLIWWYDLVWRWTLVWWCMLIWWYEDVVWKKLFKNVMIWCMLEDFFIWCMLIWFDPSCVVDVVGEICLKFYFDMMHVDMIWVHLLLMYASCLWCFCLWNFIKAATSCGQHRPTVLHAGLGIRQGSSCLFHREWSGK